MNTWSFHQSRVDRWIQCLVRFVVLSIGRLIYRVRVVGEIPKAGGALIVCNHVSYADTIPLSLATRRHLRFTSFEGLFEAPILGRCLHAFGSIPVSPTSARETIRRASSCAQAGEAVLLFPEGRLTLDGEIQDIKGGFELIARKADCPVIMAHIDGLWGSIFSNDGGRYFWKWPRLWRREITITFSAAFAAQDVDAEGIVRFWRSRRRLDSQRAGQPVLKEALS